MSSTQMPSVHFAPFPGHCPHPPQFPAAQPSLPLLFLGSSGTTAGWVSALGRQHNSSPDAAAAKAGAHAADAPISVAVHAFNAPRTAAAPPPGADHRRFESLDEMYFRTSSRQLGRASQQQEKRNKAPRRVRSHAVHAQLRTWQASSAPSQGHTRAWDPANKSTPLLWAVHHEKSSSQHLREAACVG
jgi:hypothetical protein